MTKDTLITNMTIADLDAYFDARDERLKAEIQAMLNSVDDTPKYVYGLEGLAEILGCSVRTAARIKASGKLDGAISMQGRTMIINSAKALSALSIRQS